MQSWKALAGFLPVLLFAGCASVAPAMQGEQPQVGAPHRSASVGPTGDGTATSSTTGSNGKSATRAARSDAKAVANIAAPSASASQPPKKDGIAPELAKKKASPPLDLMSLEKQLKETQAIGVLAKIALRNQVDDLLSQFREFYRGKLKTTLAELRRPYDLLVFKVLALLEENDPALAAAVVASRETIWRILSDPTKFATI